LQEEFGPSGIAVWVALLTAAKRAHVQGQFSYVSEAEAWEKLGVHDVSFSLEEFLRVTGRMKKTRRSRRGHITDVQITGWEEWNDAPRTGSGRSQKSWSQDDSARQDRASERDSDTESEREIEIDESNPFFKFLKKRGVVE
jgi:hypothetical protein